MDVSFFETTIRVLGGLLSAFEFSGDQVFLDKARDLGDRLLAAFDTPSGYPLAQINLQTLHCCCVHDLAVGTSLRRRGQGDLLFWQKLVGLCDYALKLKARFSLSSTHCRTIPKTQNTRTPFISCRSLLI